MEGDTGGRTRGTRRKAGSGGEGPASTRSRGHGTGARAPPGDQKTPGHSRATRKTSAGSHRHPHTRAVPQRLGRRPFLAIPGAGPTPQPRRQGRRAVHPPSSIHPSILPQQIRLPSKPDPEAQHPGDTLSSKGGPDRAHHTATGCGSGARAGTTGSSSPRLQGWGSRGRPGSRTPTPPPLPPGLTPRGRLRTTQHTRLPTRRTPGRAQRDPPPTQRGEARAAVGNKQHTAPPRGRRTHHPPSPRGGVLPTCSGSRHGGHCALRRGSGWGVRYPKAPSRIAREGFLTEGAPSLTRSSLLRAHGGTPGAATQLGGRGLRHR